MVLGTILFATLNHHSKTPPAWIDYEIAGYALAYDEKHGTVFVRDPLTGYCLSREAECDGGILTLTLTNDADRLKDLAKEVAEDQGHSVTKPLPNLTTSHGVRIGDSAESVRRRLGPPTKANHMKSGNGSYDYIWKQPGCEITETYSFTKDKLDEVSFFRDMGD